MQNWLNSECYNLTEVQAKYQISGKALHELIKRNGIPKIKNGWYAYVPKTIIDNVLNKGNAATSNSKENLRSEKTEGYA